MKKIYFLLIIFSLAGELVTAQGWERLFNPEQPGGNAKEIHQTLDGNYIVHGGTTGNANGQFGAIYRKIDDQGNVLWNRVIPGGSTTSYINNLSDSTYITIGEILINVPGAGFLPRPLIHKLSKEGNTIWEQIPLFQNDDNYIYFLNALPLQDGGFIFGGSKFNPSNNNFVRTIGKVNADGTLVWIKDLAFSGRLHKILDNGNLLLSSTTSSGSVIRHETDSDGNLISSIAIPTPADWKQFVFSEEETFFVSNNSINTVPIVSKIILTKVDAQLNIVADSLFFDQRIFTHRIKILDDRLAVTGFIGTHFPQVAEVVEGFFMITDLDLNVDFAKIFEGKLGAHQLTDVVKSHQSGYIVSGGVRPGPINFSTPTTQMYIFKTDDQGNIYNNIIYGTIAIDADDNCDLDASELPAHNWIVTAHKPGLATPFGAVSDAFGAYYLPVDTGDYTIHITPQSTYWEACNNDINVNFSTFQQFENVDFPISAAIDCPAMVIDLVAPLVRPCLARPVYLSYCNAGPVTATDAYLEVSLDALLAPSAASVPWDNLSAENVITWNLGDLDPLECGEIIFFVELDCDAPVGLSYCINANIFPDTICTPPSTLWSGAFLEVTGTCIEDQINFEIKNTGSAPMTQQSNYIIVEDAVLRESNETQLLAPDMGETIQFAGNGSIYTLLVDQVPNAPGTSHPIAIIQGCGENANGGFSTNFAGQFPLNDYNPGTDIDCPVAVNSFDPNDKRASPEGFQEAHYIEPATPLEYTIRFQNTGTDTAYLVVIEDTLNQWLDITTFQKGASSHPYKLGLTNQGHLSFTFYNIALPDSASNLAASNGFVDFKITPHVETPVETVITNQAAIYFDYNEPVITNETFHTIIGDYLEVMVHTVSHPTLSNIDVTVIPNPFHSSCVFQITNHEADRYQLEVFDATGKLMRAAALNSTSLEFESNGLSAGLYFYRLSATDGFLSTGLLVKY